MAEDLDNTIRENSTGPAKASADGVAVEQHKLTDQIAVDKHLSSKAATRTRVISAPGPENSGTHLPDMRK